MSDLTERERRRAAKLCRRWAKDFESYGGAEARAQAKAWRILADGVERKAQLMGEGVMDCLHDARDRAGPMMSEVAAELGASEAVADIRSEAAELYGLLSRAVHPAHR